MARFKSSAIILFLLLLVLVSCTPEDNVRVAPYSDLYSNATMHLMDVDYNTKNKIEYLNIHCTASPTDLTKEWLLNFFYNERGWSKPGYNYVVRFDGSIDTLVLVDKDIYLTYDEISYGVAGKNSVSVNIAYTGGVSSSLKPLDTRTDEQKASLEYLVSVFKCQIPDIKIYGHRDHPGVTKACPSFEVRKEYDFLQ